jgi:hypothetical protein
MPFITSSADSPTPIAADAERAVAGWPPQALDALPQLLRRIAEPARDAMTLTLREVSQADAAADPAEAALLDMLLKAASSSHARMRRDARRCGLRMTPC